MGVSFCVAGMKVVNLNAYKVGCIMFVGLFIYDVFWVFGSKVQSEGEKRKRKAKRKAKRNAKKNAKRKATSRVASGARAPHMS